MNREEHHDSRDGSIGSVLDEIAEEVEQRLEQGEPFDIDSCLQRYANVDPQQVREIVLAVTAMAGLGKATLHEQLPVAAQAIGEPGQVIGDFRIVKQIAKGGMGIVYEAEQISLHRPVALKVLPFATLLDETSRQRFLREVRTAARLEHENIVPVWAVGEERGLHYYAMRLIRGQTWAEMTRQLRQLHNNADKLGSANVDSSTLPGARLSTDRQNSRQVYFKKIANMGVQAANALAYAHDHGVVHRDIKPSNVLVDAEGKVWITDFGLALVESNHMHTRTGDLLGTPGYMSPEQMECKPDLVDYRTDIYSLGITLYELLALRPAFNAADSNIRTKVARDDPTPLGRVDHSIPKDLETIIHKAVDKDARLRYRSAGELARDLQRFLDDLPIAAKPPSAAQRLAKFARRNKSAVAAVGVTSVVSFLAIVISSLFAASYFWRLAEESQWHSTLRNIQIELRSGPNEGWREQLESQIREAAHRRRDEELRGYAIATAAGLDAARTWRTTQFGATRVAFHPRGNGLLMGPRLLTPHGGPLRPALWHADSNELLYTGANTFGPIGFSSDESTFQIKRSKSMGLFVRFDTETDSPVGPEYRLPRAWQLYAPIWPTISVDTSTAAAIGRDSSTREWAAFVWDFQTGELTCQFPLVLATDEEPDVLAISEDGRAVAVGLSNGKVAVWETVRGGYEFALETDATIRCLRFGPSPFRCAGSQQRPLGLLAIGDSGGTVTICDLDRKVVLSYCYGNAFDVRAMAFSPDRSLVAVGARYGVRIFTVSQGRQILRLTSGDFVSDVCFAHNGLDMAVAVAPTPMSPEGSVTIYRLLNGRGITTLFGLRSQISKLCFSPDGKLLAAMTHNWRVGIWDIANNRLLHVLQAPRGITADNAGLAFSPDGSRFAATAGSGALIWSTRTGEVISSLELPQGRCDCLAFTEHQLLSFRLESKDRVHGPNSGSPPNEYPRVGRLRDLLLQEDSRLVAEFPKFSLDMRCAVADPRGRFFVADGFEGPEKTRETIVYDASGQIVKEFETTNQTAGPLVISPDGSFFMARLDDGSDLSVFEFDNGTVKPAGRAPMTNCRGPNGAYIVEDERGHLLMHDSERSDPVLSFRGVAKPSSAPRFSPAGNVLVWGSEDGRVFVCDVARTQEQLDDLGLKR